MPTTTRRALTRALTLAAIIATAICAAATTAAANELAFSQTDFELRWNDIDYIAGGTTTECDVTLLGSFHSDTIEKVVGSLIGVIDHAAINNCNAGASVTVLAETLPWHLRYRGINGTLPGLTGIAFGIVSVALRVDPAGVLPACLLRTEAGEPAVGLAVRDVATGQLDVFDADQTASIDLVNDDFACTIGGDAEFNGDAVFTDLDGDPIFVELV